MPVGEAGYGGSFRSGFIPESFAKPAAHLEQDDKEAPARQTAARQNQVSRAEAPARPKTAQAEESPLSRIARTCPAVESLVSDALTTIDRRERVRKYERIVLRCPQSPDLWLWLGKDHYQSGSYVEAGRCFDRVLVLDGSVEEARELLSEVRVKLNQDSERDEPAVSGSLEEKGRSVGERPAGVAAPRVPELEIDD